MGEDEKVGAELVLNGLMVINVVTIESQPYVVWKFWVTVSL